MSFVFVTGKEFHDATEHHELILQGKEEQKKSKDSKDSSGTKSTAHHFHDSSHHNDERDKHGTSKGAKMKSSALESGWHANI